MHKNVAKDTTKITLNWLLSTYILTELLEFLTTLAVALCTHFSQVKVSKMAMAKLNSVPCTKKFDIKEFFFRHESKAKASEKDDRLYYFPTEKVTTEDLKKAGGKMKISLNEKEILLILHNGETFASQATCPHQGGPLELGDIEDLPSGEICIKCPWHSWKFDLKSGHCIHPKTRQSETIKVFPVKVHERKGEISIGFDEFAVSYFNISPP